MSSNGNVPSWTPNRRTQQTQINMKQGLNYIRALTGQRQAIDAKLVELGAQVAQLKRNGMKVNYRLTDAQRAMNRIKNNAFK